MPLTVVNGSFLKIFNRPPISNRKWNAKRVSNPIANRKWSEKRISSPIANRKWSEKRVSSPIANWKWDEKRVSSPIANRQYPSTLMFEETLKQLMREEALQDMLAHLGQVYEDFPFT